MNSMNARSMAVIDRRAFVGALAGCVLPVPAFGAVTAAGSVEALIGEGFAESGTVQRDLAVRSDVFIGDVVGTGTQSRLTLRLGAATQIKLGAEARVRIDSFIVDAGGVLELQSGAMLFDGETQNGRDIAVRSPFALIAVRGTRFFAGPSAGVFGVFVVRGRVRVTAAGQQVEVTEGKGTNIANPGARPTEPANWGETRILQALSSIQ
jgi:ferric-dicitrate binding protein FerR (iron transport regulator)